MLFSFGLLLAPKGIEQTGDAQDDSLANEAEEPRDETIDV